MCTKRHVQSSPQQHSHKSPNQKYQKRLSTMDKLWDIPTVEFYITMKTNKSPILATMQMNLTNNVVERGPTTHKDIFCPVHLQRAHQTAKPKHDFRRQGNVTLEEEDNNWEGALERLLGVIMLQYVVWLVFTWICSFCLIYQVVYLLSVHFSICMFSFNKKV